MNKTQILTYLSSIRSDGQRQFLADRPYKEHPEILRLWANCGSVQDISFETVSKKLSKRETYYSCSGGGFATTWFTVVPIDSDIEKFL